MRLPAQQPSQTQIDTDHTATASVLYPFFSVGKIHGPLREVVVGYSGKILNNCSDDKTTNRSGGIPCGSFLTEAHGLHIDYKPRYSWSGWGGEKKKQYSLDDLSKP